MKYADASAFNRSALGASGASLPHYSAGGPTSAAASRRRNGGGGGASSSRSKRYEDDYDSAFGGSAADDDWFASRARTAAGGGGRSAGGGGGGGAKSSSRSSNWKDLKAQQPKRGGSSSGTHIHFGRLSESSHDRFQDPDSGSRGGSSYRDHDRSGMGSGHDSARKTWRTSTKGSYERPDQSRGGGGGGSLLDRVGGSQGSSKGGRKPRYQGGYV